MELYPSIPTLISTDPIYAFDKLDGSNIRAEWNRKSGFMKFGTRHRLLDPNEQPLGEAVELINNTYAEKLDKIFRKERYERATAFFEFAGDNSFAGFHENEKHIVTLFDLHVYRKGILPPKEFIKLFGNKVEIPNIVYEGKANDNFIQAVRHSEVEGMTFEGVVCKGGLDKQRRPVTFKIKSYAWLDKLKNRFADTPEMVKKLM